MIAEAKKFVLPTLSAVGAHFLALAGQFERRELKKELRT
jgi:hypothetical protein